MGLDDTVSRPSGFAFGAVEQDEVERLDMNVWIFIEGTQGRFTVLQSSSPGPDTAGINRPESQLQRGRIRFQLEIILRRRHEQWVGDERVPVMAAGAPLFESGPREFHFTRVP